MRKKSGKSAIMKYYAFWNPSHTSHDRKHQHFLGFQMEKVFREQHHDKSQGLALRGFWQRPIMLLCWGSNSRNLYL